MQKIVVLFVVAMAIVFLASQVSACEHYGCIGDVSITGNNWGSVDIVSTDTGFNLDVGTGGMVEGTASLSNANCGNVSGEWEGGASTNVSLTSDSGNLKVDASTWHETEIKIDLGKCITCD